MIDDKRGKSAYAVFAASTRIIAVAICSTKKIALVAEAWLVLGERYSAVGFVGIGLHFYAIGLWWRNRRLGLDFLLHEQREPLLA